MYQKKKPYTHDEEIEVGEPYRRAVAEVHPSTNSSRVRSTHAYIDGVLQEVNSSCDVPSPMQLSTDAHQR